jgi:hypothetical protein
MSNRVLITCCSILLLLGVSVSGCGEMKRSLAPEQAATSSAATDQADLFTRGTSERDGDEDHGRDAPRATRPITEPTTIRSPGDYRLVNDLSVTQGDGIVIATSNVRLWLGTHRLYGPGNKMGRAIAIEDARNVIVTGGRIEHFGLGVVLLGATHCSVRGVDVRGGDETADPANGNPPQIGVMLINSAMNHIARNELRDVNLGLFIRGRGSYDNRIDGNRGVGGAHGLLAVCYNPAPGADPAGPHNDRVRSNLLSRFGTGIAASAGSTRNEFKFNTIRYFVSAYVDPSGTNECEHNRTEQLVP